MWSASLHIYKTSFVIIKEIQAKKCAKLSKSFNQKISAVKSDDHNV